MNVRKGMGSGSGLTAVTSGRAALFLANDEFA
jgi:hypothetical protein